MINELVREILFGILTLLTHLLPGVFVGGLMISVGMREFHDRYKLKGFCRNAFRYFVS